VRRILAKCTNISDAVVSVQNRKTELKLKDPNQSFFKAEQISVFFFIKNRQPVYEKRIVLYFVLE